VGDDDAAAADCKQRNYASLAPIPAALADTDENMKFVNFAGPGTFPARLSGATPPSRLSQLFACSVRWSASYVRHLSEYALPPVKFLWQKRVDLCIGESHVLEDLEGGLSVLVRLEGS
jgi:hypothetical protein